MQGTLELHDGDLRMGDEGWQIAEDASGILNGMTLQRERTMAFVKQNDPDDSDNDYTGSGTDDWIDDSAGQLVTEAG